MRHTLRYTVKTKDGRVYEGQLGVDIKKTLDKRGENDASQIVYEIHNAGKKVVRLWTDEVEGVTGKYVPGTAIVLPAGIDI